MLDEAGRHVLIECSIDLLGNDRVGALGAGGGWSSVRGDGDLEREKGTRTKVGFGRGENIGEYAKNVGRGRND